MNKFLIKNGKKLKCGYTTGSCAAAAAGAAAKMLFSGERINNIKIDTPAGVVLDFKVKDAEIENDYTQCYIIKDAGDDPDVTNGMKIYARARRIPCDEIIVKAGEGIGMVTRKGLAVPPGKPAINPVPMKMIVNEIKKVIPEEVGIEVEISAPEGVVIAKKTFNEKLGITGGISILGTTGIVEPMSNDAIKDSLALKVSQLSEFGKNEIIYVPGKFGERFALEELSLPEEIIAECSNFIGFMLEQALYYKIDAILLVGHIGKLVKIAGGIFNTHSRVADARNEILASHYGAWSGDIEALKLIMESNTTEEAIEYISDKSFYIYMADLISKRCMEFVRNKIKIETVLFSETKKLLAMSKGANDLIGKLGGTS